MKLHIFSHGIELTVDLRAYLERRLLLAISRFAPKLERVDAGLIDVNGDRGGGYDKRCRLVAKVAGMGRMVAQDNDADWLPLIDRTTDRFGRLLQRRLESQRIVGGGAPTAGE